MAMANELSCQELVELVTDYLEGTLPAAERARFEAHLARCDGCDTYLEQMRQTIHLAHRLSADSLAPQAREHLLRTFRDWKASQ